jgi:hypothetical protein
MPLTLVSSVVEPLTPQTSPRDRAVAPEALVRLVDPETNQLNVTCTIGESIHQNSKFTIYKGVMNTDQGKVQVAVRRQCNTFRLPEDERYMKVRKCNLLFSSLAEVSFWL